MAALRRSLLWFVLASLLVACNVAVPETTHALNGMETTNLTDVLPPDPPLPDEGLLAQMSLDEPFGGDTVDDDDDSGLLTPPMFVDHMDLRGMSHEQIEEYQETQIQIVAKAKDPDVIVEAQGEFYQAQEQQVDTINNKLDSLIEMLQKQQGIEAEQKTDEDYIRIVRGEDWSPDQTKRVLIVEGQGRRSTTDP